MTIKAFEQKQASDKIKVWNFNDLEGWEKCSKPTEPSTILSDMWQVGHYTEIGYQKWKNNLNRILHLCFRKRESDAPVVSVMRKLNSSLKRESMQLKRQITNSFLRHKKLIKRLRSMTS